MVRSPLTSPCFAALSLGAFAALTAIGADPAMARRDRNAPTEQTEAEPSRSAGPPVLAVVGLRDQRITIYDADGAILKAPVSSGQTSYETPVGIYAVLQKEAEHYSNRYDDAAMPFMQRITWTGIALHAGALPGYPASHGCVRLPYRFAEQLFPLTNLGMRVLIARSSVAPVPVSHPLLFKPTPFRDNVAMLTQTAAEPDEPDQSYPSRLGGPPPGDPLGLVNRRAALQAIMSAKRAEAEEAEKRANAARLNAKQKSSEKARASKALRIAETAKKRAVDNLASIEQDLNKTKSRQATLKPEETKAAAKLAETIQKLEEDKTKAAAKVAETTAKFDAVKAETQPKIDDYEQAVAAAKAAEGEKQTALAAARDAERKLKPVSVFISRKTGKLYVRQAFEPIFESPVTFASADDRIGTHIYTAVDYTDGGRDLRWNVVTIDPAEKPEENSSKQRHRGGDNADVPLTDVAETKSALDRITIPQDVVERISALMLPGSSLIVSDEEAHKETGKATDFVVLISGEPQGGIKLRKRQPDPYYDDFYGYSYGYGYDRRGRRPPPYGVTGPFGGPFRWW